VEHNNINAQTTNSININNLILNKKKQMENQKEDLLTREEVKGTPFKIVGVKEQGYFITLGKYRVSNPMTSIEECKEKIDNNDIGLLMSCMNVIVEENENLMKLRQDVDESMHIIKSTLETVSELRKEVKFLNEAVSNLAIRKGGRTNE